MIKKEKKSSLYKTGILIFEYKLHNKGIMHIPVWFPTFLTVKQLIVIYFKNINFHQWYWTIFLMVYYPIFLACLSVQCAYMLGIYYVFTIQSLLQKGNIAKNSIRSFIMSIFIEIKNLTFYLRILNGWIFNNNKSIFFYCFVVIVWIFTMLIWDSLQ